MVVGAVEARIVSRWRGCRAFLWLFGAWGGCTNWLVKLGIGEKSIRDVGEYEYFVVSDDCGLSVKTAE